MAGRTRGFSRGRGVISKARISDWFSITPVATAVDNSATLVASLSVSALAQRPFTLVRTHLEVQIISDQLSADENQVAAVGMCVVSDQAQAIGVTAVPTPETDAFSDLWYLHQWLLSDFAFVTGAGFDSNGGKGYSLDSKAMRKVNADEDVLLVVEGGTVIGQGAVITTAGRMLIKTH